jgi:hypothetical protein
MLTPEVSQRNLNINESAAVIEETMHPILTKQTEQITE